MKFMFRSVKSIFEVNIGTIVTIIECYHSITINTSTKNSFGIQKMTYFRSFENIVATPAASVEMSSGSEVAFACRQFDDVTSKFPTNEKDA